MRKSNLFSKILAPIQVNLPLETNANWQLDLNSHPIFVRCVSDIGATTADLPPGVLYRVKATYKYVKEDADELSFEVGEMINVIEYDDPDDQVNYDKWQTYDCVTQTEFHADFWPLSFFLFFFGIFCRSSLSFIFVAHLHSNSKEEGWLMGQKDGTTIKGLFPANFTRPL